MLIFKSKGNFNVVEGMMEITPRLSISELVVVQTPTVPENINNNTNTDNTAQSQLYLKQSSYIKNLRN